MTKIPWTEKSWNPVVGCTKIAAGCKNCYAERMAKRFWKQWGLLAPPHHFGVKWFPERLDIPLHWRKPRKIFVCSMGDLFHEAVPYEFIGKVILTGIKCPQHTFQILTKRMDRALEFSQEKVLPVWTGMNTFPKNIWWGTSISTQADLKNIEYLLQIPAAVRFVSLEPMLARIYLPRSYCTECGRITRERQTHGCKYGSGGNCRCGKYLSYVDAKLDWVIIGCESGPGARLCSIEDIRDAVRQCKEANVPVFVKQVPVNGKCNKKPIEWPKDLRIQEYPK